MTQPESQALSERIRDASEQRQFLTVMSADEARVRFESALSLKPLGTERVRLADSLGRILSEDVVSAIDVPGFDRASMDGFALRSEDTIGATEANPARLKLNQELLPPGIEPRTVLRKLAGHMRRITRQGIRATLAVPLRSELGRTEFVMVGLLRTDERFVAYPSGSGSGSVTSFSQADGFVPIDADAEGLAAGTEVEVHIIGQGLEPADAVAGASAGSGRTLPPRDVGPDDE